MKNLLSIIFILFINSSFSQNFKSIGKVEYSMYLINDAGINNYSSILYFNEENSKFSWKIINPEKDKEIINSENNYSIEVNILDTLSTNIYFNKRENKIYTIFENKKSISYYEDATKLEWNYSEEQKKINKFNCHKATTSFRGRDYIAYYTEDIPVSTGPFKFVGLPGLIIELYDTKKEVYFKATTIKIPDSLNIVLQIDSSTLKTRSEVKTEEKKIIEEKKIRLNELKKRIQSSSDRDSKIQINDIKVQNYKGIELD